MLRNLNKIYRITILSQLLMIECLNTQDNRLQVMEVEEVNHGIIFSRKLNKLQEKDREILCNKLCRMNSLISLMVMMLLKS
jgi:hypothetical protein